MDIIFDKTPGEIHDIFSSLWVINNFKYAKEESQKMGTEATFEKLEAIVNSIVNNKKINNQKLEQYFDKDTSVLDLIGREDIWKYKELKEYLNHLSEIDCEYFEEKIVKSLSKGELDEEEVKNITSSKESIINYVNDLDIKSSVKWEIFSMINYKQKYMYDFIQFINEYIPIYKSIQKERIKHIKKFNDYLEKNIKQSGIDFIKNITKNIVKLDDFEKIYITSVYIDDLTINIKDKENTCYIYFGVNFENVINKMLGSGDLENNLNIFKNISDKTRFQIIKLLLKRDYYGLEIAQALSITTATVSYHMDYLLLTGIVHCEKRDHKAYYSLNKDTLRNTIQFLSKELDL